MLNKMITFMLDNLLWLQYCQEQKDTYINNVQPCQPGSQQEASAHSKAMNENAFSEEVIYRGGRQDSRN